MPNSIAVPKCAEKPAFDAQPLTHTLCCQWVLRKERINCFLTQPRNSLIVLSSPSCWGEAVTEQHRGHLGAGQGEHSAAGCWVPGCFWGPSPATRCLRVPSLLQDSPTPQTHRQSPAALCRHCVGQHACSGTEVCPQHSPWHHMSSFSQHLLPPLYFIFLFISVPPCSPFSSFAPLWQLSIACLTTISNFLSWCSLTPNSLYQAQEQVLAPGGGKERSSPLWFQCFCETGSLIKTGLLTHQEKLNWEVIGWAHTDSFC